MKRSLLLSFTVILLFSCQKENVSDKKTFAEASEPVVEHVNISLTDESLRELLSAATPVIPETRAHYFIVEYNEDIDFWATKGLAVILFGASWSGPTKMYYPTFHDYALSCAYPNAYFGYCDVDQFETLATKYEITTVPTTVLIRYDKTVVSKSIGVLNKKTLDALVDQYKVNIN